MVSRRAPEMSERISSFSSIGVGFAIVSCGGILGGTLDVLLVNRCSVDSSEIVLDMDLEKSLTLLFTFLTTDISVRAGAACALSKLAAECRRELCFSPQILHVELRQISIP